MDEAHDEEDEEEEDVDDEVARDEEEERYAAWYVEPWDEDSDVEAEEEWSEDEVAIDKQTRDEGGDEGEEKEEEDNHELLDKDDGNSLAPLRDAWDDERNLGPVKWGRRSVPTSWEDDTPAITLSEDMMGSMPLRPRCALW